MDFNRGGTPLAEIVTEPDIRSAEQAGEWLRLLRITLRRLGVSDVNMEEGSLRCDANISLRPAGSEELGVKTELKNMNSFRFIERGIKAELARQQKILDSGERVMQETLHFDPRPGAHPPITSLRSKEQAHDYRYFPEPDLLPIAISEEMLQRAREAMPELPAARASRLAQQHGLSVESAELLAFRDGLGDYFEQALVEPTDPAPPPQVLANWLLTDLLGRLEEGQEPAQSKVARMRSPPWRGLWPQSRSASARAGRCSTGCLPMAATRSRSWRRRALARSARRDELAGVVAAAIAANADAAERVKAGNAKAVGPIVGYVMRETKGRADGGEVNRLIAEQLRRLSGRRGARRSASARCSPALKRLRSSHILDSRPMRSPPPAGNMRS